MININKYKLGFILFLGGAFLLVYFIWNPSLETKYFPKCPSKWFFGLNCPGCGSQRAIHRILNGEVYQAFFYNPLLVVFFPFVLYVIYLGIHNFVSEKKIRPKLFYNNMFVWLLFVVVVAYFILRNIPISGLEFLIPPDK